MDAAGTTTRSEDPLAVSDNDRSRRANVFLILLVVVVILLVRIVLMMIMIIVTKRRCAVAGVA